MYHADKTVTVYRKTWDAESGTDMYQGTVLGGVSFFSRIAATISTDGLTAACEGVLRIPLEKYPDGSKIKNGDLVCEGAHQEGVTQLTELDGLDVNVFTVVGVTHNVSGRNPHMKVVCK